LLDLNGLLATELRDLLACWGELAEFFRGFGWEWLGSPILPEVRLE
jgi:hypothetical protein